MQKNNPELHRQIVQKFLETRAVDFAAAGRAIAELGPFISSLEDPELVFCGTTQAFFHCYRLPSQGAPVEDLAMLRAVVETL